MADEADRFEIFPATVDVGDPFALLAAVIAIEHGRDGIDAQSVDMEVLEPIKRGGNQETLHFAAPKIVDEGIPVLMKSFTRIEMLVERSAIEAGESMSIGRKTRRALRRPEPSARRKQAQRLIAPGTCERMLGNGKKLNMGEPHIGQIGDEALGRCIPGGRSGTIMCPEPGVEMQLVDRNRGIRRLSPGAFLEPWTIVPARPKGRQDD